MARTVTGRELADNQKTALYHRLLQLKKNGHVGSGDMKEIMRTFNGCVKKGRCGAPRKYDRASVRDIVTSVPTQRRANFRSLAASSEIHKTSLWNLFQANMLHPRTSRVKPMLFAKQKSARRIFNLAGQVLDKTFMTLQKVMEEAFKLEGDNVYKLPHLKKDMQLKSETVENSGIETSMR
ncbi:hypothetical protein B5M09_012219 [Aphanomyces astaci]|uniref:Uncharacterized protein n=1 Tax=Aphanomyces astaci TaxID=112090 RepID=A0A425DL97_APHAT|nr:hypothetical protein B5M09_012219 [Aphanomyces astaci]